MTQDRRTASLAAAARAELDDLLVPLGFGSGQGGAHQAEVVDQVIFCVGYRDFVQRFPHVAPPYDYEGHPDRDMACLDLIVEGSLAAGVIDVQFEGAPLSRLLREAGHAEEAAAVEEWPGTSIEQDMIRVRLAMDRLLASPGQP